MWFKWNSGWLPVTWQTYCPLSDPWTGLIWSSAWEMMCRSSDTMGQLLLNQWTCAPFSKIDWTWKDMMMTELRGNQDTSRLWLRYLTNELDGLFWVHYDSNIRTNCLKAIFWEYHKFELGLFLQVDPKSAFMKHHIQNLNSNCALLLTSWTTSWPNLFLSLQK